MTATTTKQPTTIRVFHIILGLIAIGAAFLIIADPGLGVYTLVLLLSVTLLILGISRLARGMSHKLFSKMHKAIDVMAGVLSIILGFVVLIFPLIGASTLVLLLAVAAMVYGITTIMLGAMVARLSKLPRAVLIVTGVLSVVFSFAVIDLPALGMLTLVVLLAASFLVSGVESIVSAI